MQIPTTYPLMNPSFSVEEKDATTTHASIVIEPLEQGYGHTLGNALRRVLLTSLPGAAITQVRIEAVDHQFSTIAGVTEDVLELSLNLKQIRIKADREGTGMLRLSVKGAAEVTAAAIDCEAGFSVVNPDTHIARVAKGATLSLEMTAASGVGYVVAADKKGSGIGDIMLDALFSPVIKVSYKVEATRVGRRTDFDRLLLDIQTDGTVTPLEAVKQAAQILQRQFGQVIDPVVPVQETPLAVLSPEEAEVLKLTVEELDLPTRIANALRKGGFKTVGDLMNVSKNTVAKVKNLGGKSVSIIDEALQKKGVRLSE